MTDDRRDLEGGLEEARVRELLGTLREDVRAPAGLRAAVMRRIDVKPPSLAERALAWILRPRLVPISPAMGGLAVAALAGLLLLRSTPTQVVLPSEDVTPSTRVVTRFVLVAPGATSVHLTGDFVSWQREGIALENLRGTGIWTGDVALPPGVHEYTFVLDGSEWVPDPTAALHVQDGFGQVNSIVVVPEEGAA